MVEVTLLVVWLLVLGAIVEGGIQNLLMAFRTLRTMGRSGQEVNHE